MSASTRHARTLGWAGLLGAVCAALALATPARAAGFQPTAIEGHQAPAAGEHPRLIMRGADGVKAVRDAAATPWGQKVSARIHQALKLTEMLAITGRNREVIKEAGFKAAGYAAVYVLDGDAAAASKAKIIALREVVNYPMLGSLATMDHISRLQGVAVAYDLCYDAWDEPAREKVREWLVKESAKLLEIVGGPGGRRPEPEHITACATAGLAELAVLGEADDGGAKRIAACEKAVLDYLDNNIGDHGFDANGESVRQVAFASGILPFVRAERNILGRDLTGHPGIQNVFVPMLYQTVTESGTAVTGAPTATVDRTGLFALGTNLVPADQRPAVAWLFKQIGGEKYLGIVRPHHGLDMLTSGMGAIEPAPPGDGWAKLVTAPQARYAVLRSGWKDSGDLAAVLYDGSLRIIGMGAPWADKAGPHAAMWSHDPGAGSLDNIFIINPSLGGGLSKTTVYRTRYDARFLGASPDMKDGTGSVAFAVKGVAERVVAEFTRTEKGERGQKIEVKEPIPEGGPFEGARVLGADYTGKAGAPGLIVIADRLTGGGKAPHCWVLHLGALEVSVVMPEEKGASLGNTFTAKCGDATLQGTVVYPADVELRASSNNPVCNFVSTRTDSDRFEVILTIQRGKAPEVKAGPQGLDGKVKVGGRTVSRKGDEIVFE